LHSLPIIVPRASDKPIDRECLDSPKAQLALRKALQKMHPVGSPIVGKCPAGTLNALRRTWSKRDAAVCYRPI
jgi:hypothetical protein